MNIQFTDALSPENYLVRTSVKEAVPLRSRGAEIIVSNARVRTVRSTPTLIINAGVLFEAFL